jgi:hypothetical protein
LICGLDEPQHVGIGQADRQRRHLRRFRRIETPEPDRRGRRLAQRIDLRRRGNDRFV